MDALIDTITTEKMAEFKAISMDCCAVEQPE